MNNTPADKNRRVLVIDDNRSIHDDFRKILSPATAKVRALEASEAELFGNLTSPVLQSQFEVDSAYQGQEGLARVKEALETGRPYAMAFVDVRMPPGWDGVETTRKIWEIDPDLQVVLCTAYSDYSWNEMFETLGHHDGLLILKKPFDSVEAFQLAHALTEKRWLHQQSRQKMEKLESQIAERTAELQHTNHALQTEVAEHTRAEDALRTSQHFIEAIINAIPAGVFWKDRNLAFLGSNAAFARDAGFADPKDIIGKDDSQMVWRDQAELYRRDDRQVIESGCAKMLIEEPHTTAEGKILTLLTSKVPLRSSQGDISGVIGMYMDITERKQMEERVRLQAAALDAAASAVVITERTGTIRWVNRAFSELTGYSAAEVAGQNPRVLKSGHHPPVFYKEMWETILAGKVWRRELVNRHKDGRLYDEEMTITPVRDADGSVSHFIAIKQEITKRKRAEEELHYKTALLQAQLDSTLDGILVVDDQNNQILKNARFNQVWKIPRDIAEDVDDTKTLQFATNQTKNPGQFLDQVAYLYSHPDEISRDELELVDGTVLDRYSSPVRDKNGKHYGRIWTFHDITERKRAEVELRSLYAQMQQWLDHAPVVLYRLKIEGQNIIPVMASANVTRLLGFTVNETMSYDWWQGQLHPEDRDLALASHPETFNKGASRTEYRLRHKDGSYRWVDDNRHLIRDAAGRPFEMVGAWVDITERKRLEAQLFQSQKMETVGRLAGGVAHEFNSIMTAIIGQSELLLADLPAGNPLAKNATEIHKAADRAAVLTRQLLAYGRKQILQPEILDLNRIIVSMESMLHQVLGSDVDLRILPAHGLHPVKADAGQIEQVIMNLAINSRDAMPQGGKLTIETSNVILDQESVGRYPDLKPGGYVMLAITDTGTGMSPDVKSRLFEPFFSTKGVGRGTGLGLATCYGILKQSGGHINAYSEPGRGTTFKVYLPQVHVANEAPRLSAPPNLPQGAETILLVEDDPALREMAAMLLGRLGYTVLEAPNGLSALAIVEQRGPKPIDLLFTDVIMPELNGKDLSDRLLASHPETLVLFTSAYTENAIVHQGVLNKGVALLQKPFTPSALALKVREVLDAKASS